MGTAVGSSIHLAVGDRVAGFGVDLERGAQESASARAHAAPMIMPTTSAAPMSKEEYAICLGGVTARARRSSNGLGDCRCEISPPHPA